METTKHLRQSTVGCAIALSMMLATVANAQLTETGYTLRLDAAAENINAGLPSNGDLVVLWNDTGSGNLDVTGEGASAPTWLEDAVNNLPAVRFDGINDVLTRAGVLGSDLVGASQSAAFLVLRPTAGQDSVGIFSWHAPAALNLPLYQVAENPANFLMLFHGDNFANHDAPEPANWNNNEFRILTLIRNGSSGTIRVGGVVAETSPNVFGTTLNTSASGTLRVGATGTGGANWAGDVAEILVYNSGTIDVDNVENYLGQKYGLAPVPEPSQYATVFGLVCVAGALIVRSRRQRATA